MKHAGGVNCCDWMHVRQAWAVPHPDDMMIVGRFTLAARLFQRLRTAVVRPRTVESADD